MSLVSSRSAVIALGIATVVVVAVAVPARSRVLDRDAGQGAASKARQAVQSKPPCDTGQYPDVDIQVIHDYSANSGTANPAMVRIHMDIKANKGNDLSAVKAALENTNGSEAARRNRIYNALEKNTEFKDCNTLGRGRAVVRAALGY
jgi:hypothetical protein